MAKRKRSRKSLPMLLMWDRRSQARFIESVERLTGLVNDLAVLVEKKKRRSAAATAANVTRSAAAGETIPS